MDVLVTGVDEYLKSGLLPLYYLFVAIFAGYLLLKYSSLLYAKFIILLFWEGLFIYIGEAYVNGLHELYKIFVVLYAFFLFGNKITVKNKPIERVLVFFILFASIIFLSTIINLQPIITSLSQFGKKYLLPFLFFFGIVYSINTSLESQYSRMFKDIITSQIFLSIIKIIILGFGESIVGSIAFLGGGLATTIPILGFLFIWIQTKGKPQKKDWQMLLGLLIIALASNKRAPVFIMPILLITMYVYVYRSKKIVEFLKYIPLLFAIFYLGVKTNPTLNPEKSRWGTFDLVYSTQYANDYMFGKEHQLEIDDEIAYGRGGSFLAIFTKKTFQQPIKNLLLGYGVKETLKPYDEFDTEKFGVSQKGALNGARVKQISYGLGGLIAFTLYGLSLIYIINIKRLKYTLILVFLWDLFLYDGMILEYSALSVFFIYTIVSSNIIENESNIKKTNFNR